MKSLSPRMLIASSAVLCIAAYRRYISPFKGYRCAYHAATGRSSCSAYAQRAIGKTGLWNGIRLLRRRLKCCALAAVSFAEETAPETEKFFGRCDPAVQEFRKLYCRGCIGGLLESLGD